MSASQAPGDRLSALDAAFLYLERTGQLLHVAGIYPVAGALDYQRQLADLTSRLHLIPRYTHRVVNVPFGLAHPTWEPDPHFDVRNHVMRHVLRPPGDDAQLAKLVNRLFAEKLDRRRPLWEVHQIDGYQGDRSVLFAKVHHCMIDGVSGVQLLEVMFDPSPNPVAPPPAPESAKPPALPSPTAQLVRVARDAVRGSVDGLRALMALARQPRRVLAELGAAADAALELGRVLLHAPPPTPFNGHVGTMRQASWTTLSLNEAKAIKNRLGGTVNDVVLTTISAALRVYLEEHGWNPERTELRAMCPVNRYRQVRAAMAQLKATGQSARMARMVELIDLLPPPLQMVFSWVQMAAAPINTICTNIPGPPVSLYVQGKRLEALVPLVPLAQGVGLAFAILSYADNLTIGVTVDPALVPEADRFAPLLETAFLELRELAGVEEAHDRIEPVRPERQRRLPRASLVA